MKKMQCVLIINRKLLYHGVDTYISIMGVVIVVISHSLNRPWIMFTVL